MELALKLRKSRVITAMVTPFSDDGEVDFAQARRLALALINSGSDGVVVSGTTGESPTLSREEKIRLFYEVKEAVGDKGVVIAGTGSYDTRESCKLSKEAEEAGVDGLLLVSPYYNRPPQEGLYRHFEAVAKSTSHPCILYNIPSRTAVNILPETVVRLSRIDNIVGVKEASGNLNQVAKIISDAPGFLVWSGNDSDTFPILALGGFGVISVASHLVGKQIRRMVELFLAGRVADAAEINRRLLPLFSALFITTNPIPIKYALNRVGFRVGKPRLPLVEIDDRSAADIDAVLKGYQIDLSWS